MKIKPNIRNYNVSNIVVIRTSHHKQDISKSFERGSDPKDSLIKIIIIHTTTTTLNNPTVNTGNYHNTESIVNETITESMQCCK